MVCCTYSRIPVRNFCMLMHMEAVCRYIRSWYKCIQAYQASSVLDSHVNSYQNSVKISSRCTLCHPVFASTNPSWQVHIASDLVKFENGSMDEPVIISFGIAHWSLQIHVNNHRVYYGSVAGMYALSMNPWGISRKSVQTRWPAASSIKMATYTQEKQKQRTSSLNISENANLLC